MIERMKKLLIVGPQEYREQALERLQQVGTTQVDPYHGTDFSTYGKSYSESAATQALTAYKLMLRYRQQAKKENFSDDNPCELSVEELSSRYTQWDAELKQLRDEATRLRNKREFLEPWGHFNRVSFEEMTERSDLSFQFWEVPHKTAHLMEIPDEVVATFDIAQDDKRRYILTVAEQPIALERALAVEYDADLSEIDTLLKENGATQRDIRQKLYRASTKAGDMLELHLEEMTKVLFGRAEAGSVIALDGSLFALLAWCPLSEYKHTMEQLSDIPVNAVELPFEDTDRVPTKIKNKPPAELGEDLVKIYDPPSYKDWDPSAWVLFSFTIFFAMIMADGGYGIVLVILMLFLKWKVKDPAPALNRFFNLTILLGSATFIYGIATGGFFGLNLDTPSFAFMRPITDFLKQFRIIDSTKSENMSKMMQLSVLIGIIHIDISLLLKSLRSMKDDHDFITPLINVAWISGIWLFYFWYVNDGVNQQVANQFKDVLLYHLGAIFVLYAIETRSLNPAKWIAFGLLGVYNGVQFFSDVLSYIRIFALGLSGALIAQTFNGMAMNIWHIGSWWAFPFAALVFVLGHMLNIALCIMGGVIHGLRLNFLEWYRWTFDGGGRLFEPFRNLTMKKRNS